MLPFLTERFANPSGAHRMARDANRAVDEAREEMAELLGCSPGEVIFTSGGTESDNLAVFGARRSSGETAVGPDGLVVCSAIEHHAVLDPTLALGGATVGVDGAGRVDLDELAAVLDAAGADRAAGDGPGVRLVSVMTVNNEVGTVQPVAAVADDRAPPRPWGGVAHRRRPGPLRPRPRRGRLGRRPAHRVGSQVRRPEGHRRARGPVGGGARATPARRRPGAGPSARHPRRGRHRGRHGRGSSHGRGA